MLEKALVIHIAYRDRLTNGWRERRANLLRPLIPNPSHHNGHMDLRRKPVSAQ
jgi:hypothetical protein